LKSLKREDCSRKQPESIRKNMLRELIIMLILIFEATSARKLRKSLFESTLNDEIEKVEEESEDGKEFKRDDSNDTEDKKEIIIIEHRPNPLTVINTPIQENLTQVQTQPVVKHRRILRDDN
jgi:hypothetical protein